MKGPLSRAVVRAVASGLVATLLLACGDDPIVDTAGGRELLLRVQTESYRGWARAPGWASRTSSRGGGHGGQIDIYLNEVVVAVLDNDEPISEWPEQSTIVKDVWSGTALHAIAIMEKRAGGWYWAEFNGAGDVSAAGQPEGCTTCHQSGVDFVRGFSLP